MDDHAATPSQRDPKHPRMVRRQHHIHDRQHANDGDILDEMQIEAFDLANASEGELFVRATVNIGGGFHVGVPFWRF